MNARDLVLRDEISKPSCRVNIEALQGVSLAVAQERNLETVMRLIVHGIAETPGMALVRLWYLDSDTIEPPNRTRTRSAAHHFLRLMASAGRSLNPAEDWTRINGSFSRIRFGVGKVGLIGQSGESVFIPDLSVDQRWVIRPDWVDREALQSFAGHPLKFRDEVLGVLGLFSRARLNEIDFRWLLTFANHAAVAIANARSFEELEHLHARLEQENRFLQTDLKNASDFGDMLGESTALRKVLSQIQLVANTQATVLISGESGTGKELVARAVHEGSARRHRPFIKVNCGAVPEHLFESEFFGHVRGAFTGAVKDRLGRFQVAEGGTLFLDEIGEVPLALQVKLLRILQERQFERVGDDCTMTADVRIVAATNRDLKQAVASGSFRQDLYSRLNVFPIEVPPLRERREDIPNLAAHFLRTSAMRLKVKFATFTEGQMEQLQAYEWPGNVRELQNVVERALIVAQNGILGFDLRGSEEHFARSLVKQNRLEPSSPDEPVLTRAELKRRERESIAAALRQTRGKIGGLRGAAALLGMKPTTLTSRVKALGLGKEEL
ncbi:MAG: sigma 54-interacting transcriptional regulator [Verrucomicrobia bacterium]|nr:sigma 54-interacting transcriptional regulator [Verrucomicrobiota bacterium]